MEKIILTPEQVKSILNWDYYENGELEIDSTSAIEWSHYNDNEIIATWQDKEDPQLTHKKLFTVESVFKTSNYADFLNKGETEFYQKIADYINNYFKDNGTWFDLPF